MANFETRRLSALTITLPSPLSPMAPSVLVVHALTWGETLPVCTIAAERGLGNHRCQRTQQEHKCD